MSAAVGGFAAVLFTALIIYTAIVSVAGLFSPENSPSSPVAAKTPWFAIAWLTAVRTIIILLILILTEKSFSVFSSWDGHHYMLISENGYASSGENAKYIVFYPLYPLCMAILSLITQNSFVSGIIISNLCFIVSLALLYKLCRFDTDERDSLFTMFLFALSPFSFFFSGVYTESLFVMLCLLFFISLRTGKYIPMALCAFFAALTRVHGILLFIPAAYELLKNSRKKLIFSFAAPLGFGIYLIINKITLGEFFAFSWHQEDYWSQHFSFFAQNIKNYVDYIAGGSDLTLPIMLPQLVLFFISSALIFAALRKKLNILYILYSIAYVFVTYSASWLLSGGRYLAALFPLFIFTAHAIKNSYARIFVLALSVSFLSLYTVLYVLGMQVM